MKKKIIVFFALLPNVCFGQLHTLRGEEFIKRVESLSLQVYMDGPAKAVGYGHHIRRTDPAWIRSLEVGDSISEELAELLFRLDMLYIVEPALLRIQKDLGSAYPSSVYDCFASLVYNCGERGFRQTHFYQLFREKDYVNALLLLPKTAAVLPGLKVRRTGELKMLIEDFDFDNLVFVNKLSIE